jgi:ligand-binding sensor domain-containing protein/signal transduction histidine kinase
LRLTHLTWLTLLTLLGSATGDARSPESVSAAPALQYTHRIWQTDEGLPHNLVRAITQTPDGYLWVGTRAGLARFDGLRFTRFDTRNTPAIKNSNISALCVDETGALWIGTFGGGLLQLKDGVFYHYGTENGVAGDEISALYIGHDSSLWVGTTSGLSRYYEGRFTIFRRKEGLASEIVRSVVEDRDGTVWIATGEGLNRWRAGTLDSFATTNGLPGSSVRGLWLDPSDRLWIGSDKGLLCYDRGAFRVYTTDDGLTDSFVNVMCQDGQGTVWIGTYGGLNRFSGGRIANEVNNEKVSYDLINALFVDREGTLWVGSRESLARLTPKRLLTYTRQQGLGHNNIMSVRENHAGNLWIGTWGGGLNQLQPGTGAVTVYSTKNSFPHDLILSTCEARDGSLWAGADFDGGLSQLKDGRLTHYSAKEGLINAAVRVIHEDHCGNLWVGTSRGLSCLRERKFTSYFIKDGLADDAIRAICEDHLGRLWFGTEGGLNCWQEGQFAKYTVEDGLAANFVVALYEDPQHDLWIGTQGGGLFRMSLEVQPKSKVQSHKSVASSQSPAGQTSSVSSIQDPASSIRSYTTQQGLFSNDILEILEDDFGCLWLSSYGGLSRVSKSELNALDRHLLGSVHATTYGRLDGMLSVQCNGVSKPAGWKSRDGRLWFPTTKGLVSVDPRIPVNNVPPPVVIEEVLADKKVVATGEPARNPSPATAGASVFSRQPAPLTLPPGQGELEIHYTALSLQTPEKDRFRYQLEGVDTAWVEADTRRTAYYNHVHPGRYRFRVMACNNDGLWNEQEAALDFVLRPWLWQMPWFLGLCALTLVGGLGGAIRYVSVRRLQHQLATLEQQHAVEKERARIAKDIHDDLGASLTQITLLSDRSEAEDPEELRANTRKISATAREMAQSLDEIVWAVNPQHDTLEGLVEYLSQSADDFLEDTSIRSRLKLPPNLPNSPIPAEVRHQLFLAFKEVLNNAVKHAAASEIQIEFIVNPGQLQIVLADNGVGFDPATIPSGGNGLQNMRKRLDTLGGEFELTSRPGQGTQVRLSIPLPNLTPPGS